MRAAFTLIELLCASTIVGSCVAAIVTTWAFAFNITAQADRYTAGYAIGRSVLEQVKETGFQDTAEGTTTVYYDGTGATSSTTATASSAYTVTTVVSSDALNGSSPASTALRTVTITVTHRSSGVTVYTCTTYLARAGI